MLGSSVIEYFDQNKEAVRIFDIDLQASHDLDELFLVFKNPDNTEQYVMNGDWIQLNYDK